MLHSGARVTLSPLGPNILFTASFFDMWWHLWGHVSYPQKTKQNTWLYIWNCYLCTQQSIFESNRNCINSSVPSFLERKKLNLVITVICVCVCARARARVSFYILNSSLNFDRTSYGPYRPTIGGYISPYFSGFFCNKNMVTRDFVSWERYYCRILKWWMLVLNEFQKNIHPF
jgi:hypothetical protein